MVRLRKAGRWFLRQHAVLKAALLTATCLVALALADLSPWSVPDQIADDRQIALLVAAEAVLLALVFGVLDAAADRRTRLQWEATAGPVIASLRLDLILTQQRLDHAIRHPDDDIAWTAMAESARWLVRHVQSAQPLLVVHPELATFAPRFMTIVSQLADRSGALQPDLGIRQVANDPGVKAQTDALRRAVKQLVSDTRRFAEQYGTLGDPGFE